MVAAVVRSGREFTGMVVPEGLPTEVASRFVRPVHMFDVPAVLREHAGYALGDMSGSRWWTLGEFRYVGEDVCESAVARRVGAQIQYGIEKG